MLTRRVRVQAVLFVIIGLLAAGYVAIHYVGLLRLFGVGTYRVQLELPAAGGIFPNAEVDYRGIRVGRVNAVSLTADGVQATLDLDSSAPRIPADVEAVVADRSVIGEQYVDLRPRTDSAPYLANGDVIGRKDAAVPLSATSLLQSTDALLRSVPVSSLRTVVGEFHSAFGGSAQDIRELIANNHAFFATANQNFPQTAALIDLSRTVLRTQLASAASIQSFSANLRLLSSQLASSDSDLRALLADVPPAARSAVRLVREVGSPLGVTINNLISTAQVSRANIRGVQELLVQLPHAVDIGSSAITPRGANVGLALTFFDPLPCSQGYGSTHRRGGLNTGPGAPLNTAAGCTAGGSTDVRGAQHVPSNSGVVPVLTTGSGRAQPVTSLGQLMGS